ncbi:hypothetical protein BESB_046980 [Besnoitia besnoiti]|uniref:Uncharacterized protein n=1 Tax=Besnoitia besnoiti TaxID=94643 RepID=A0A2A9MKJ3_BESBE|nr:hypothetical protein BESB_046980 [Besnoitia besnoiti]PFH36506.1 hypothetical protein BESB_046980 [Besnoitia besnoiti]
MEPLRRRSFFTALRQRFSASCFSRRPSAASPGSPISFSAALSPFSSLSASDRSHAPSSHPSAHRTEASFIPTHLFPVSLSSPGRGPRARSLSSLSRHTAPSSPSSVASFAPDSLLALPLSRAFVSAGVAAPLLRLCALRLSTRFASSSVSSEAADDAAVATPQAASSVEPKAGLAADGRGRAREGDRSTTGSSWCDSWRASTNFAEVGLWRGRLPPSASLRSACPDASAGDEKRQSNWRAAWKAREQGREGSPPLCFAQASQKWDLSKKWRSPGFGRGARQGDGERAETQDTRALDREADSAGDRGNGGDGENKSMSSYAKKPCSSQTSRYTAFRSSSSPLRTTASSSSAQPLKVRSASEYTKGWSRDAVWGVAASARLRAGQEGTAGDSPDGETDAPSRQKAKPASPFSSSGGAPAEEMAFRKSSSISGTRKTHLGRWSDAEEVAKAPQRRGEGGKSGELDEAEGATQASGSCFAKTSALADKVTSGSWSTWRRATSYSKRTSSDSQTTAKQSFSRFVPSPASRASSAPPSSSLFASRRLTAAEEAWQGERASRSAQSVSSSPSEAPASRVSSPYRRSQAPPSAASAPSSPPSSAAAPSSSSRRPWTRWSSPGEVSASAKKDRSGSAPESQSSSSSSPGSSASLLFSLEKREEEAARMEALRMIMSARERDAFQKDVDAQVAALPADFLQACGHHDKVKEFAAKLGGDAALARETEGESQSHNEKHTFASSAATSSALPPWPCLEPWNGRVVTALLTLANYRLSDYERLRALQPPPTSASSASSFAAPFPAGGGAALPAFFASASGTSFAPAVLSPDGKTPAALFHSHKQYAKVAAQLQEAPVPVRSLAEALVVARLGGVAFKNCEKKFKLDPELRRPLFASSTLQAIYETLETGACAEVRERRQQRRLEAIGSLTQVAGVGRKTAEALVDQCGILSAEELRLHLAVAVRDEEAAAAGAAASLKPDSAREAGSSQKGEKGRPKKKKTETKEQVAPGSEGPAAGSSSPPASALLSLISSPQMRVNVLYGAALTAQMHPSEFLMWQKKLIAAVGDPSLDSLAFSLSAAAGGASQARGEAAGATETAEENGGTESKAGEEETEGYIVTPVVSVGGGFFTRSASPSASRPRELEVFLSMLPEPLPVPPASLLPFQETGCEEKKSGRLFLRKQPPPRDVETQAEKEGGGARPGGVPLEWSAKKREALLEGMKERKNELFSRFLAVLQNANLVEEIFERKEDGRFSSARLIVRLPWNAVAKRQLRVRVVPPDRLPFLSLESRCSGASYVELQAMVKSQFGCQLTADRLVFPPSASLGAEAQDEGVTKKRRRKREAEAADEGARGKADEPADKADGCGKLRELVNNWVFTEDQLLQALQLPHPLSLGQRLVSLSYRGFISASGSARPSANR